MSAVVKVRETFGFRLYSYVVMPNHVHLLIAPASGDAHPFELGLAALAGRDPRFSGPKRLGLSTLVLSLDDDHRATICARYHDLNPVRAKLVARPEDYDWSSYRARAGLAVCSWLDREPQFETLGTTAQEQAAGYRKFVESEARKPKRAPLATW